MKKSGKKINGFLVLGLMLAVTLNDKAAASLLFTTNTVNVGDNPLSVAAADFDGDGRTDLVSANASDNTLTVLTNKSLGTFGFKATVPVGVSPHSVAVADVNHDGWTDVISADAGSFGNGFQGVLTVLTNNGAGGFALHQTIDSGSFTVCVVASDVTGDARPDLICANANDNTLAIFTNNGFGQFSVSAAPTVGVYPYYVAAADVNADGKLDLISADQDDDTLTVLTNGGGGNFSHQATYVVGESDGYPYCVTAADINGDGKMDLISANAGENTLTVLTNSGSGHFVTQAHWPVGDLPSSVIAADLNADGWMDLVSANENDKSLTIMTNAGSGSFGISTNLSVGESPAAVITADFNSDGVSDLVSANNYFNGTLTVLLQLTRPELSLHIAEAQLILSWTSSFPNFQVKTNGNLASPVWGTASYPVTVTGGTNYSAIISPAPSDAAEKLFFRLQYQ